MSTATRVFSDRLRSDQYQCGRCGIIHSCTSSRAKPTTCAACARYAEVPDQSWADHALCAQIGGDAFFPDAGVSNRAAKAVCGRCPVTDPCLAYALSSGQESGVWGGLSERERRAISAGTTTVCPDCGAFFYGATGYNTHQRAHLNTKTSAAS